MKQQKTRSRDGVRDFILGSRQPEPMVVRVINSLERAGVTTMEQLDAMSDQQITGLRDIGEKGRPVIYSALKKYRKER